MSAMNRRTFLQHSAIVTAGIAAAPAFARTSIPATRAIPVIQKALKFGMIAGDGTIQEKFMLAKSCGYDGIELDSPSDWDMQEVINAKKASGLTIHGVVLSSHWSKPFNHQDESVRDEANESLERAIRDCKELGGTSVLVVPAVVNASMTYSDAYSTSQAELRKHIPLAESLGITLAFENVWNNFLLSPIEAARYVDEFESDHVGWYFDVGNIVNIGYPDHWIRTLSHRIKKLDVKDFSKNKRNEQGLWKGFDVKIGDGDSDWESVCNALQDIGYTGWATAEVGGGGEERLTEIANRMDKVFKPLNR